MPVYSDVEKMLAQVLCNQERFARVLDILLPGMASGFTQERNAAVIAAAEFWKKTSPRTQLHHKERTN